MGLARVVLCIACIALPAFGQAPGAAVNRLCPVMPEEEVDENSILVRHEGRDVRLCCKKCKAQFLAEPTRWLLRLPQFGGRENGDPESPPESFASERRSPLDDGSAGGVPASVEIPWLWRGPFDFGQLHLLLLHFPIALLLVVALVEGVCVIRRLPLHSGLVPWFLRISAVATYLTVGLGLRLASVTPMDELGQAILGYHRWAGIATAGVATLVVILGPLARRPLGRPIYLGTLALAALCVSAAAHLGGLL